MNKKSDLFKIKIGKYQNNIKSNTNVTLCNYKVYVTYFKMLFESAKKQNKRREEKRVLGDFCFNFLNFVFQCWLLR